jgi:hypothetical protein
VWRLRQTQLRFFLQIMTSEAEILAVDSNNVHDDDDDADSCDARINLYANEINAIEEEIRKHKELGGRQHNAPATKRAKHHEVVDLVADDETSDSDDDDDDDDDEEGERNANKKVIIVEDDDDDDDDDEGENPIVIDLTGPSCVDPRQSLLLEYTEQANYYAHEYTRSEKLIRRPTPPDQICDKICLGCRYEHYWKKEIVPKSCYCRECRAWRYDHDVDRCCVRTYCIHRKENIPGDILIEMERVWTNLYESKKPRRYWNEPPECHCYYRQQVGDVVRMLLSFMEKHLCPFHMYVTCIAGEIYKSDRPGGRGGFDGCRRR